MVTMYTDYKNREILSTFFSLYRDIPDALISVSKTNEDVYAVSPANTASLGCVTLAGCYHNYLVPFNSVHWCLVIIIPYHVTGGSLDH